MSRTVHRARLAVLLVAGLAILAVPARAADQVTFGDLDAKTQKDLCEKARSYFDPSVEFLWRPRKELLAVFEGLQTEKGVKVLADMPLLREIVYQGRHFLEPFDDKRWQRDHEITDFKKSQVYNNLKSEQWQFTYTQPRDYPKDRDLDKVPRTIAPYPLLLAVHDEEDTRDGSQSVAYPGEACLRRRYPKDTFDKLYDAWLTLAPVAPRGKFLEDDGLIRHRFLTAVLTEFWRRYNVDFDRIVIDGGSPAAAMAAAFPHIFAGFVLRPSKDLTVVTDVVRNYAGVPVFVVGDEAWGQKLRDAGHPDVTVGGPKELAPWLEARHRVTPRSFHWTMVNQDHKNANWIDITVPDYAAPERTLDVEVVDTEADPNTIKIQARGMEEIMVYLNDEIVDLDREVRLLVNDEELKFPKIERDFGRLFDKDPYVRKNMYFGWLYSALLERIKVPAPGAAEKPTEEKPVEEKPTEAPTAGDAQVEKDAAELWAKAEAAEQEENKVKARLYYQKVVDLGQTTLLDRAKAKLEELGEPQDE